jgi:hypothetical protein
MTVCAGGKLARIELGVWHGACEFCGVNELVGLIFPKENRPLYLYLFRRRLSPASNDAVGDGCFFHKHCRSVSLPSVCRRLATFAPVSRVS